MNQSEKNEVDLLLRALGRDARQGVSSSNSIPVGAHLDADELNSFAENAIPLATSARYASHLADCDECRRLVTQLSQSAGVVLQPQAEPSKTSFWTTVGSLFSPVVLRYAVPALGLICVMAIGLFVVRQQREKAYIAQAPNAGPREGIVFQTEQNQPLADNVSEPGNRTESKPTPRAEDDKAKADSDNVEGTKTKQSPEEQSRQAAEAQPAPQPSYAPEPTPQSPPPPTQTATVAEAQVSREQEQRAGRDEETKRTDANKPKDRAADARAENLSAVPMVGRGIGGLRKNEGLSKERPAKSSVATRSVAGREFRRDNDGWVDTAYESGRATVIVKRGSEQFRALVADEPQLKTIAESLSGTVIVVWKGRAYRFQ